MVNIELQFANGSNVFTPGDEVSGVVIVNVDKTQGSKFKSKETYFSIKILKRQETFGPFDLFAKDQGLCNGQSADFYVMT